jgi:hypothetical protein
MHGVAWKYATRVGRDAGNLVARLVAARTGSAEDGGSNRLGVYPTASPSAYACDAATAFLAAISLAFWRISSAKRGI